jgi:plastocyanin
MKNTLRLFLPLLLLAVLVVACGNTTTNGFEDQDNGLGFDETPMFGEEPGVGEPMTGTEDMDPGVGEPLTGIEGQEPALLREVDINAFAYDPQDLTVEVGYTVTWTNNDTVAHTVTAGTPDNPTGEFDSGTIQPGETFSYTFDQAGTFDYYCTLHPDMTGSVTVEVSQ